MRRPSDFMFIVYFIAFLSSVYILVRSLTVGLGPVIEIGISMFFCFLWLITIINDAIDRKDYDHAKRNKTPNRGGGLFETVGDVCRRIFSKMLSLWKTWLGSRNRT